MKYLGAHPRRRRYLVSWLDFTDEEISMALSHIAAGRGLCCQEHEDWRRTITSNRVKQEFLGTFAYDVLGCHPNDLKPGSSQLAFWLNRLEEAVARGEEREVAL